MFDKICVKYLTLKIFKQSFFERTKKLLSKVNQSGMGTVEIIIIVAVLVALALLFKTFILDMSSNIFSKIKTKTDAAIDGL